MNRFSLHSPWLRLALAALVTVWSGYGAAVRSEAFERDLAPRLVAGAETGAASETGLGAAALTYALFWADDSTHRVSAGPGGHGVRTWPPDVEPTRTGTPADQVRSVTGARRPLRHLLCVYRL